MAVVFRRVRLVMCLLHYFFVMYRQTKAFLRQKLKDYISPLPQPTAGCAAMVSQPPGVSTNIMYSSIENYSSGIRLVAQPFWRCDQLKTQNVTGPISTLLAPPLLLQRCMVSHSFSSNICLAVALYSQNYDHLYMTFQTKC